MTDASKGAPATAGRARLVWLLGALSFGIAFVHRVAPSAMVSDLMRDFAVGAAVLGNLSAIYFYAYAALQIPVGVMLDRWGPRRMLSWGVAIGAVGGLIFALAETLPMAYLGRLLVGIGSATGFVGSLKLTSNWFRPERYAFLSGLTMFFGMLGGVVGQAPMAVSVGLIGWRNSIFIVTAIGGLLAAAIWLLVRDRPPGGRVEPDAVGGHSMIASLRRTIATPQVWLIALFSGAMAGPLVAYAGLWAVPHLMAAYGIDRPAAAGLASVMFIGFALGSPVAGWLSDSMHRRKPAIVLSAAASVFGWLVLIFGPALPLSWVWALMLWIGLFGGAMVVAYAIARENVSPGVAGATTGFVNTATVGTVAATQPLIGWLLDLNWRGDMVSGARSYPLAAYEAALVVLPAFSFVALLAAALIRETHCRALIPQSTDVGD